ncbi:integrase catalytic domain-containing protein [Trichonephila clavipes]|nr:integrase catalytic domain-containing protein [Trichonephila clavipes]
MAFLMIEIDESERDFTRFFWDENPGIDLENKRLDIFRMTRVLFGVKSSLFLLAATIKHHLKKYVDIFPDTFNHLNQTLYVDDFLCGNVSVQAALTTCIESKQILEDASMDLRKWRTNSSELNQRLKNLNFEVDEHKESLNTLMASKGSEISYHELRRVNYVDGTNRSSSEFTSLVSTFSSDPNDLNPLTSGHFLTNCAISSFPEPYTASDSLSYHSRWKLIQSLRDKFWNHWSTEYLTHLQTRAKWSLQNPNLMENQLVLLKDPNTKPLDWPMGRILEVFPGSDGLVRVVNVKTSTGILKRAITKVVPLPIPVDPATVEKNN